MTNFLVSPEWLMDFSDVETEDFNRLMSEIDSPERERERAVHFVSPEWLVDLSNVGNEDFDRLMSEIDIPEPEREPVVPLPHTTSTSQLFGKASEAEVKRLRDKNVNKNTQKSTISM